MESQNTTIHQELDSIIGITTCIPRLLSAKGFPKWKYCMEKYIKMNDFKIWRSILKGSVWITTTLENGTVIDKEFEDYTDEYFERVKEQDKALATLTMALSLEIA